MRRQCMDTRAPSGSRESSSHATKYPATGNIAATALTARSRSRAMTQTTRHDRSESSIRRFDRAERIVHWTVAVLMIVCIVTAAILYNGAISIRVGQRHIVELIHVYCGFALPVPILLGLISRAWRADL